MLRHVRALVSALVRPLAAAWSLAGTPARATDRAHLRVRAGLLAGLRGRRYTSPDADASPSAGDLGGEEGRS